jgi:hypothetical protein
LLRGFDEIAILLLHTVGFAAFLDPHPIKLVWGRMQRRRYPGWMARGGISRRQMLASAGALGVA